MVFNLVVQVVKGQVTLNTSPDQGVGLCFILTEEIITY